MVYKYCTDSLYIHLFYPTQSFYIDYKNQFSVQEYKGDAGVT